MLSRVNHVNYAIENLRRKPILTKDLRKVLSLPEVICQEMMEGELKKTVNHTVIFFNAFTEEAGRELLLLLIDNRVHDLTKSVMKFIGVWDGECNEDFYNKLVKELA